MSQVLKVVALPGKVLGANEAPMLPQEEVTFERIEMPYVVILPFLFVIGLYVWAKKFAYRLVCGRKAEPETNCWFIDGLSINSRRVKDGASRWPALHAVYNFKTGEGSNWLVRAIDSFWLHVRNAQAVRNRLKIVKRELMNIVLKQAKTKKPGEPVLILSLASGSGQGAIEVVANLMRAGVACELLLIDQDASALAHARHLAVEHGIIAITEIYEGDVFYFEKSLNGRTPDVIEMCGILDYLDERHALFLIKKAHKRLAFGGWFLTCHIHWNGEAFFLMYQENWWMRYRTRDELRDLLVDGHFIEPKRFTEPLGIHTVAVAQKQRGDVVAG